jgi:hypothetical protein
VLFRAIVAVLASGHFVFAADGSDPEFVRKESAKVADELQVQRRLPTDAAKPEASVRRRVPGGLEGDGEGFSIPLPGAVLSLMQWALLAVLVVAVLAVLAIVAREPLDGRLRPPSGTTGPPLEQERRPADPRVLLAEADRLAATGRYAEAMHCVLLAAMAMLAGKTDRTARETDSLTSWEVLRGASLAAPQMQVLRDLVVRVERAWFGHFPAGDEDYRNVRSSFDAFARGAAESA